MLSSKVSYDFTGELTEDGTLHGTLTSMRIGYAATNKREEIKKFNSIEEYKENIYEKNTNYKINTHEMYNLDDPSQVLTESQEIEFKIIANKNDNEHNIIPFISNISIKNPINQD